VDLVLAQERLGLLDGASHFNEALVNTTDHEFGVKTGLVNLLNDDSLPLNWLEKFLENLVIPNNSVALDEIDLANGGLKLREILALEFSDDEFVKVFETLSEIVQLSLESDSLFNEGGQGLGICIGCHRNKPTFLVYETQHGLIND
jgi:hypothetical protein